MQFFAAAIYIFNMKVNPVEPITPALQQTIKRYAEDATIGAGNDAETPTLQHRYGLAERIGHDPNKVEWDEFLRAWCIFHQAMEQP